MMNQDGRPTLKEEMSKEEHNQISIAFIISMYSVSSFSLKTRTPEGFENLFSMGKKTEKFERKRVKHHVHHTTYGTLMSKE